MTWDFLDFPGAFPVTVIEAEPPRRSVIEWAGVATTGDSGTSRTTCEGWTGMLAALKAWLEHGINLREGFYR
ncbi:hypothetical protein ACFOYW_04915 [Gryllotalpicola reticulitermitis]|uniref:Activator of Hsp90 ATPase homolog 1-like protein n=1 Tax=Gryllotalpicola reticulitermitis TaxID=1184153 RepID=A0ABV8Q2P6_9MICO